jgi:hypothetical protein
MGCKFCNSPELHVLTAEMNIHFPGQNLTTPTVWAFPPVTICLHCGAAEFMVHGEPLKKIRKTVAKKEAP